MATYVNLTVPDFSLTLGGYDLTPFVTKISITYPSCEITTPQSRTGELTVIGTALTDTTPLDDQLNPTRWLRGKQQLILTVKGILAFTGYIISYRFDRQNKTGQGKIGDQIELQDFNRTAIAIPLTLRIRDKTQADAYKAEIDRKSFIKNVINNPYNYDRVSDIPVGEKYTSQFDLGNALDFVKTDKFVFSGPDTGEVVQNLVLESGVINGIKVFGEVQLPVLTGDISIAVVTTNPIQEAQKIAGVDSVFMYCRPNGTIPWQKYPQSGNPIFQLTEDQCSVFKPDLTVDQSWSEEIIVTGEVTIQSSNPAYLPKGTQQIVVLSSEFVGGQRNITNTVVVNQAFEAVGSPYIAQTIPISGRANFVKSGIDSYLPKTEKIDIGYLYSVTQANNLANFIGNLKIQKSNSYLVVTPISTEWLNNPAPFQICHIADAALIMDGVQLVISADASYLAFTGNKFGSIPLITNPSLPAATPAPISFATNLSNNLERELSDIGTVSSTTSELLSIEKEYSGVTQLISGFAQWHRSEEKITLAVDANTANWGDLSTNKLDFIARLGAEPNLEILSRLNGKQVISFLEVADTFIRDEITVSSPCTFYLLTDVTQKEERVFEVEIN